MALFNITNNALRPDRPVDKNFKTSNRNIHISERDGLKISEHTITEQEWLGNF